MSTRLQLSLIPLPVILAGVALTAVAQTDPQGTVDQPVAAQDRTAIESAFSRADANNDGRLSKEEAAKLLPAIAAKFDELDKDKDGSLSLEEFSIGYTSPR